MERDFSLAYLTVGNLTPPEAVSAAAETGYRHVGLRLLPSTPGGAAQRLQDDPALLRETLARCKATGIGVFDLEIIRIGEAFRPEEYRAFMEAGERLGARAILVAGDDPDEARLTASFASLCQMATPFGLTCDLEFMPWTAVLDAAAAVRIVGGAAQENARVLVDALHFSRSGSTLDQVASMPPGWLSYAQICDAPACIPSTVEEMVFTARSERLLPGEGGIALADLFATLPGDLPVSVEIPSESRVASLGPVGWARQALVASQSVLASLAPCVRSTMT